MNSPSEGANFEPSSEIDRHEVLKRRIADLLIAKQDILEVLYDKEDVDERPILRVLGGWMSSASHKRVVHVGLVSINYPDMEDPESSTISVDKQQFVIDEDGARRTDNHLEDPDEEEVVLDKMLEVISPGITIWTAGLTTIRANEMLEAYGMLARKVV